MNECGELNMDYFIFGLGVVMFLIGVISTPIQLSLNMLPTGIFSLLVGILVLLDERVW